jgi:hypothetical protein
MQEVWKPVAGYEGVYEVSNHGRVRSLDGFDWMGRRVKGKLRKTKKNNRDYVQMSLSKDGTIKYYLMHRLVAEAFVENPDKLPQVNHKDENKNNNCADNLEWCTNIYNRHYGTGLERAIKNHDYEQIAHKNMRDLKQMTPDGELVALWHGVMTAYRATGIHESGIRNCCYGKAKTAGGYKWAYV